MVKINKKKLFITSFILAVFVFLAGLLLGLSLDSFRVNDAFSTLEQNELDTESYYAEQHFLEIFGGDKCELAQPRVTALSEELREIGQILTKYEAKEMFKGEEFKILKQRYFLSEIKMYTLLKELKERCNYDATIILFFYDPDHQLSMQQGHALDALVIRNKEVIILSIDRTFTEDPLLETVKLHFDIIESPTIVVNYNIKKEGFVNLNELLKLTE